MRRKPGQILDAGITEANQCEKGKMSLLRPGSQMPLIASQSSLFRKVFYWQNASATSHFSTTF
jgi:hypothetical protein